MQELINIFLILSNVFSSKGSLKRAYSHRPTLGPLSTRAAPPLNFLFVEIHKNDNCRHLFHFLAFQTKSTCASLHISINWPFYAVKVLQLLKK